VLSLLIYLLKDVLESAVILLQDGVLGAEWKEVYVALVTLKGPGRV